MKVVRFPSKPRRVDPTDRAHRYGHEKGQSCRTGSAPVGTPESMRRVLRQLAGLVEKAALFDAKLMWTGDTVAVSQKRGAVAAMNTRMC